MGAPARDSRVFHTLSDGASEPSPPPPDPPDEAAIGPIFADRACAPPPDPADESSDGPAVQSELDADLFDDAGAPSNNRVRVVFWNCNGWNGVRDDAEMKRLCECFDVIIFGESRVRKPPTAPSAGFGSFLVPRRHPDGSPNGRMGGLLAFYRSKLVLKFTDMKIPACDVVRIDIGQGADSVKLLAVYLPPLTSVSSLRFRREHSVQYTNRFWDVCEREKPDFVLGDFNAHTGDRQAANCGGDYVRCAGDSMSVDTPGRSLLTGAGRSGLVVLNGMQGRYGGHTFVAPKGSRGMSTSLIDYCLGRPEVLHFVRGPVAIDLPSRTRQRHFALALCVDVDCGHGPSAVVPEVANIAGSQNEFVFRKIHGFADVADWSQLDRGVFLSHLPEIAARAAQAEDLEAVAKDFETELCNVLGRSSLCVKVFPSDWHLRGFDRRRDPRTPPIRDGLFGMTWVTAEYRALRADVRSLESQLTRRSAGGNDRGQFPLMIHWRRKEKELRRMRVSLQHDYRAKVLDYWTHVMDKESPAKRWRLLRNLMGGQTDVPDKIDPGIWKTHYENVSRCPPCGGK